MQLYELLNELLSLITIYLDYPQNENSKEIYNKIIFEHNNQTKRIFYTVNDKQKFDLYINDTLKMLNEKAKLSNETITDYTIKRLIVSKMKEYNYTLDNINIFIQELRSLEREVTQVITNIVGIDLEKNQKPIQMGCFEVGYFCDINDKTKQVGSWFNFLKKRGNPLYFKANIYHLDLDDKHYNKKISLYTLDFIRLLLFISGNSNSNHKIKTGSEFYDELGNLLITDFYHYLYLDEDWQLVGGSGGQKSTVKLSINELVSLDIYEHFQNLWNFYQKIQNNPKSKEISDIHKRILSASLAVGESIRSEEEKNSLIYTCIALESLFSFNEEQLFQRSIGDKIADCLAFIVGTNKEGRKGIIKHTKEIYKARCALVHGSQSSKTVDLYWINDLIRTAIGEFLRNKKYKDLKTINQLYDMVKDARLSY
ncbi:HEPN domain-containing protein [Commensalibacter oyaizuii]|uniref:HEPN domain-containing protein n=1 Tax=Commensalibacter oyaizuii TaxID=3043873 RepID=A0ABT6PZW6_9PROT|nr:HEPN domain-containing protein [Commensalibacter sp. TBRC 16381]MDI2090409.1 HEPN domain-containing protein [Commensalibacter sp. TBRC 16381]